MNKEVVLRYEVYQEIATGEVVVASFALRHDAERYAKDQREIYPLRFRVEDNLTRISTS